MEPRRNKKLAVFFDGTWNSADQHSKDGLPCPTNITKLFEATMPEDGEGTPQIAHYVIGVGTRKSERIKGGGFGFGISENIKEGYRFLISNYYPGDQIYIFGFSRGAYTARSLAGLIRNVGILKRNKVYLINEAYEHYKDRSKHWHPNGPAALAFRKEHTWGDERIRFLGVFDTVGALGAPFGLLLSWIVSKLFKCTFHDTRLSAIIESAYHALALDEHRLPFLPTLMKKNDQHDSSNFDQKWFPGVHSDIGGGYSKSGLSDLALEWMTDNANRNGLNIDLKNISVPKFEPNVKQDLNISQTRAYRILAVLTVKMPSYLGLVTKQYRHALKDLHWNGDYVRPVSREDIGELGPFLGSPPQKRREDYQGCLHYWVIDRMNGTPTYKPHNVSRWMAARRDRTESRLT